MKKWFWVLALALLMSSCTDATQAKLGGYGDRFSIEILNCDGTVARTYVSSGKVLSEESSDGYYFMEEGTNVLTEVTGNLVIRKLKAGEVVTTVTNFTPE